jgi:hypothetical protein
LATDLRTRLEAFAASPDGQALKNKFADGSALKAQAEALAEKLKGCLPK